MKLHNVTQQIIHDVELKTGYPVHVLPDEKLNTLAVVRMARGPMAMHVITYKPVAESTVDYMICFQCGFILDCLQSIQSGAFHIIQFVEHSASNKQNSRPTKGREGIPAVPPSLAIRPTQRRPPSAAPVTLGCGPN